MLLTRENSDSPRAFFLKQTLIKAHSSCIQQLTSERLPDAAQRNLELTHRQPQLCLGPPAVVQLQLHFFSLSKPFLLNTCCNYQILSSLPVWIVLLQHICCSSFVGRCIKAFRNHLDTVCIPSEPTRGPDLRLEKRLQRWLTAVRWHHCKSYLYEERKQTMQRDDKLHRPPCPIATPQVQPREAHNSSAIMCTVDGLLFVST